MQQFVKICVPQSDKTMLHTFMVCLWICVGSAGYGIAALFAKHAAIRRTRRIFTAKSATIEGLRRFTRRRTATRPSKCGAHGGRKSVHMAPRFQVPSQRVCYILFDVYRTCDHYRQSKLIVVHTSRSGKPNSTFLSMRPGLSRAGSRVSGLGWNTDRED